MNALSKALLSSGTAIILASSSTWGAEAPQKLALKFAAGDRARYELVVESKIERGEPKTPVSSKVPPNVASLGGTERLEMQMMAVVKKLDAEGLATIDMTIQGLRHISPPATKVRPGPLPGDIRGGVFKTKTSSRGGQVKSRSFDTIAALGPEGLEIQRIQGSLYPELPDNPLSVGDKWNKQSKLSVNSDALNLDGEAKFAYKFDGVEEKEGEKCAVISVEGTTEFKVDFLTQDLFGYVFAGSAQRTGKYFVNLEDQRLARVHLDEKVHGDLSTSFISKAQGTFPVSYEHSVDFRILESKAASELVAKVDKMKVDTGFKEAPDVIDFQDSLVRFSHGNHKAHAAMFKEKFGEKYRCGLCHNGDLPGYDEIPLEIKGKPFETVEEIRNEAWRYPPYGAGMNNCLKSCHDDKTAPGNCELCHVAGSKVLQGE